MRGQGWRRSSGETDFRFSLILFGGYVKMTGEQPGDEGAADPRALTSKPRWQRLLIAFAGPAINIVLAVALAPLLKPGVVKSLNLPPRTDGTPPKLGVIFSGGNVDLNALPWLP